jgi:(R,R)-butanediol dehydrogenase/meso-butanediol dehydrogenase/diacetyl reductase
MAHKLPDAVSTKMGALVEPISVAYHAAKRGESDPEGTALVFGAGPSASGHGLLARPGIEDVLVVEPSQTPGESIERLGARTLDLTALEVPAFIADHTQDRHTDF